MLDSVIASLIAVFVYDLLKIIVLHIHDGH